jgi:hypothetical protein
MNLGTIARLAEKYVADNSPHILTGIGVAGTLTTAVLTGKASMKAARMIDSEQYNLHIHAGANERHELTNKEKVLLVWKLYIPPATLAVATVTSIVLANQIGTRRTAAMASAFVTANRMAEEYQKKVVEKLGETKESQIRSEVNQERLRNDPVENKQIIITGGGNVLCYEPFTGRYFDSSMEDLKQAMNDTNYMVLNYGYASLSDFYDKVGLPHTEHSDEMGWRSDRGLIDMSFDTNLATDGRPCLTFDYGVEPIRNFYKVH